jgi:SAM-dependent methyltransferase
MDEHPATPQGIRRTYTQIAAHFAETRTAAWPAVERFCRTSPDVELAVDLGCGNGRHLPLLEAVATQVIGVDLTRALLQRAEPLAALVEADGRAVPIVGQSVDRLLVIAVVHHLQSTDRQQVYAECARLLSPRGRGLISVWAVDHPRFDATAGFDAQIPWTRPDGERIGRFYHIFDAEEFRTELKASPLHLEAMFVEAGNLFAVVCR